MMNRAERRANERKARKEARKADRLSGINNNPAAEQHLEPALDPLADSVSPLAAAGAAPLQNKYLRPAAPSMARIAANQANAQLSTGPRTTAGKAASSRNALKTGLTGRTVLLPGEDAGLYQNSVDSVVQQLRPLGLRECELVQAIADSRWRLARIPSLEAGVYALARIEFAGLFPEHDPEVRASLIQAKTFLVYNRQLNNLSIQEQRLRRQLEKDLAALRSLQADRRKSAPQEPNAEQQPESPRNALNHPPIGFVFSPQPVEGSTSSDFAVESDLNSDFSLPNAA